MAKSYRSSFMACYGLPNPNMDKIEYICWQEEICPKTNRHHWQTFVRFKSKNSILALQKAIGIDQTLKYTDESGVEHFAWKCHIKPHSKGTDATCIEYCQKSESSVPNTFMEFGKKPDIKPGKRTDIEQAILDINSGKEPNDLILMKYPQGVKALKAKVNKVNTQGRRNVKTFVYWGGAGTGKTSSVIKKYGQNNVYTLDKSKNEVWFDGYDQEKVLLIDDFYGWIPWGQLLRLTEGNQVKLQVKCHFTYANWDKVYITSNKPYEEWYPNIENYEALDRRICSVTFFKPLPEGSIKKPLTLTLKQAEALADKEDVEPEFIIQQESTEDEILSLQPIEITL